MALSLAESFVFGGFLGGVVCEGLAFFLGQQRCLRCFVDGWGCLRTSSLGCHRGWFARSTNGGRQMLELARQMLGLALLGKMIKRGFEPHVGRQMLELALLGKLIQRGSESNVDRVLT